VYQTLSGCRTRIISYCEAWLLLNQPSFEAQTPQVLLKKPCLDGGVLDTEGVTDPV
jgi:hypothetical protein